MNIMNALKAPIGKVSFFFKKYDSEIYLGLGIVTGVAGAIGACIATAKFKDEMNVHKERIEAIHEKASDENTEMTKEEESKELTVVYKDVGMLAIKTFAPSVILGASSITFILMSHRSMQNKKAALAAALTSLDASYREYVNRVRERVGDEVEAEIRNGIHSDEVEAATEAEIDGKPVTEKTAKKKPVGRYCRIFDRGNEGWSKDPSLTKTFLRYTEQNLNDMLNAKGYLFYNEVLEALDFPPCPEGQVVGWVKKPNECHPISFGLERNDQATKNFMNGNIDAVVLDFNVQGYILETAFDRTSNRYYTA